MLGSWNISSLPLVWGCPWREPRGWGRSFSWPSLPRPPSPQMCVQLLLPPCCCSDNVWIWMSVHIRLKFWAYHGTHMISVCLLYVCLDFSGMWSHLIRDSPDVFLSFICHLLSVCLDFSRYKVSGLTLSGASNCTFLRLSRSSCRPSGFPSFSRGIGLKIYLCSWAENIYV